MSRWARRSTAMCAGDVPSAAERTEQSSRGSRGGPSAPATELGPLDARPRRAYESRYPDDDADRAGLGSRVCDQSARRRTPIRRSGRQCGPSWRNRQRERAWMAQRRREAEDRRLEKYAVDGFSRFVFDSKIPDKAALEKEINSMRRTAQSHGFSEQEVATVYDPGCTPSCARRASTTG